MGPQRDDVWREKETIDALPPGAKLEVRWRTPIHGGFAGPAVAGGKVFVTDFVPNETLKGRSGVERVVCLNEKDGQQLWALESPTTYTIDYGSGPRATPVVDGDRVYALGAEGELSCINVANGSLIWGGDTGKPTPVWGFAAHPLIDAERLITLTGPKHEGIEGTLVAAFDKRTGDLRWNAVNGKEPGYCPPTMIEAGGVRQLIIFTPDSVNSLDPATGKVYWTQPFGPIRYGVSITTPRHVKHPTLGDLLVVSSYWDGSMALRLEGGNTPKATVLWKRAGHNRANTGALHSLMVPPIITPTHLYGVSNGGELRCLDLATGDVVWETYAATTGEEGHVDNATAFLVPNPTPEKTFLFNERGEMILARLSPSGYTELGRTKLLDPTSSALSRQVLWCHPALANQCVYWRNDREIICVSLAAKR